MQKPKLPKNEHRITVRVHAQLWDELSRAAAMKGITINEEIKQRCLAATTNDLLRRILDEQAEARAMIAEMHSLAIEK